MNQNGFRVILEKTTKVAVDEKVHGLPPFGGNFAEYRVSEYPGCPEEWSKDGIFVEVVEGQPLWIDLRSNPECAVLCAIQRLNPVTGEPVDLEKGLSKDPIQNYLALPAQMWLDGYAKDGKVYQFVVTKAGEGLAVNEYVLPKHMQDSHALGFAFFSPKNPKPVIVNNSLRSMGFTLYEPRNLWQNQVKGAKVLHRYEPPPIGYSVPIGASASNGDASAEIFCCNAIPKESEQLTCGNIPMDALDSEAEAGLIDEITNDEDLVVDALSEHQAAALDKASMGMGGRIDQRIVPDSNTVDYYHDKPTGVLTIYMALPDMFKHIMSKGVRQDASRKDKFVHSGEVAGIPIPLI